ncbi:hypothetical protein C2S51_001044, partial [Perilla frutescens var. frutescens]
MVQGHQQGLSSHPHLHPHPLPHPHPHPHHLSSSQSHALHEAIRRELEKERIREEIIMSEILRRRALEAEVRSELMMERELALQGRSNGFGSPSRMGLDLPMRLPLVDTRAKGRFHEERIMLSLTQRNNLNNRSESDLPVSLPFQSASDDVRAARNSEVKPIQEGVPEKKKIILQATPMKNITGAKRAGHASESQSDGNLKKKVKEEWSCALCQVSPTSERGLNEHLEGKKHKMKEAELRAREAGKNYSIGLASKKVAKPIQGSGTVDPGTESEVKFTSESLPFSKSGDARSTTYATPPSQKNLKKKKKKKKKKNDKPEKKNYKFWCEICQIGVANQNVMNLHEMGKKHRRQLDKRNKCSGVGPTQKPVEETLEQSQDSAVA